MPSSEELYFRKPQLLFDDLTPDSMHYDLVGNNNDLALTRLVKEASAATD